MKTSGSTADTVSTIAASIAPEDVAHGDYVAILNEVFEFPSFFWSDSMSSERDTLVRVRYLQTASGLPLKVKTTCLPFVFVTSPLGECQTLDIRRVQLVRLNRRYAKEVWRTFRKQRVKHEHKRKRKSKGR